MKCHEWECWKKIRTWWLFWALNLDSTYHQWPGWIGEDIHYVPKRTKHSGNFMGHSLLPQVHNIEKDQVQVVGTFALKQVERDKKFLNKIFCWVLTQQLAETSIYKTRKSSLNRCSICPTLHLTPYSVVWW